MKVSVIGVGFIGLPTAAILANNGFNVVGIDVKVDYIEKLKNRTFTSEEKGLMDLINRAMDNENLCFSTEVQKSDVFILCTPTPVKEDKEADLTFLLQGINGIIPLIEKNNIIIVESTIPPGTINNIVKPLMDKAGYIIGKDIFLAYCPERVIPNNIIYELINTPRIIGGFTKECGDRVKEIYKSFVKSEIYITTPEIVEMVKLIENAYRDVNIAFSNEVAMICSELMIDPYEVITLANKHPRVHALRPGIGVGGHCLPIDSHFLINRFQSNTKLMSAAREINNNMPKIIFSKINNLLQEINMPSITIWGITYKKNTNDIRNSPSLELLNLLKLKYYDIKVWDPKVCNKYISQKTSLTGSDLLLILVDHDEIVEFNYNDVLHLMRSPVIFDGVNIIDSKLLNENILLYKLGNI